MAEEKAPKIPRSEMICSGTLTDGKPCLHQGVRARGLCGTCYNRATGVPTIEEFVADKAISAALDRTASRMLEANSPLLNLDDMDSIAQAAASVNVMHVDFGLPEEGEKPGVTKARNYLLKQGAWFRRKIIRQMMANGIAETNDIFLSFFRDPELRKRWIEPLADPWAIFQSDITKINTERQKAKTTNTRRSLRIERLEGQYRIAMSIANDSGARTEHRMKALEMADRIQKNLDTLEHTIKPLPGRGQGAVNDPDPEDNDYASPDDDGEEEDDERKFHLPDIE